MRNSLSTYENISFNSGSFPVMAKLGKLCLHTPPGRHAEAEIKYFTSGECAIVIDDETITPREGDIVIIPPFRRHYTYSTRGDCRYHLLNFDLNFLKSELICDIDTDFLIPFREGRLIPTPLLKSGDPGHAEAVALFKVLEEKGDFYQFSVKTAMMNLFCTMLKSGSFSEIGEKEWLTARRYSELLRPALQYIDDHYRESISTEDLARVCNYNPKYFCKMFKEYTSQTAMDYVSRYRLHKAELELVTTDHSIADIAVCNGFFDASHFSRYYKKMRGFPPSKMRNGSLDRDGEGQDT